MLSEDELSQHIGKAVVVFGFLVVVVGVVVVVVVVELVLFLLKHSKETSKQQGHEESINHLIFNKIYFKWDILSQNPNKKFFDWPTWKIRQLIPKNIKLAMFASSRRNKIMNKLFNKNIKLFY